MSVEYVDEAEVTRSANGYITIAWEQNRAQYVVVVSPMGSVTVDRRRIGYGDSGYRGATVAVGELRDGVIRWWTEGRGSGRAGVTPKVRMAITRLVHAAMGERRMTVEA